MAVIPKPYRDSRPVGPKKPDARSLVINQWRGLNVGELEKTRAISSRRAGEVLPGVLRELGMDRRRAEAEILKVWNHLIDPTVTAHAQPTGIHKGTLFVTVDSSAWHCEIMRYSRHEILERLQNSFGRDFITRISFRVG
jgi:predicted nucleic acid-binding Zn ribbon protein